MLRVGKQARPHLAFTAGDGTRLPFADGTFDAVTISFGLRNIVDPDAGLREMRRVTRPGGRLVVCEFSHPTWAPFRTVYVEYLMRALPSVARAVSSSPDAYVYLAESIRAWPDQAAARRPDRRRPGGPARAGATCPAASSRCTTPPPDAESARTHVSRPAESARTHVSGRSSRRERTSWDGRVGASARFGTVESARTQVRSAHAGGRPPRRARPGWGSRA